MNGFENHKLRRTIDLLPALLTVANLFFGYFAILSAARGTLAMFDNAAKFIGWAILFDGLDGRVARLRKVASPFGKEFDSLADVISFGVAPAFLALTWGLRGLNHGVEAPALTRYVYQAGWIACFAFLICGAWRLARFNIQAAPTGNPAAHGHRYFIGIPIPAAAGVIAATVHFVEEPITDWRWAAAWAALVAGLAFLMVSSVRYHSFKELDFLRGRTTMVIVIGLLIGMIYWFSRPVLLLLAVAYLLSGLLSALRRRFSGSPG